MSLTLYIDGFWISPYAMSAFVALEELGVPHDLVELSMPEAEHKHESYRAVTGRIPALRHEGLPGGDLWLAESQAIDEYLAELFPPPAHPRLYPEDRVERAVARQIQAWIRSDLVPIREERSTHTIWYEPTRTALTPRGLEAKDRLARAATNWLGEREQLFQTWSIADADLALMLRRLVANGDPMPQPLVDYVARQFSRPSLAKWDTHVRPPYRPY